MTEGETGKRFSQLQKKIVHTDFDFFPLFPEEKRSWKIISSQTFFFFKNLKIVGEIMNR